MAFQTTREESFYRAETAILVEWHRLTLDPGTLLALLRCFCAVCGDVRVCDFESCYERAGK